MSLYNSTPISNLVPGAIVLPTDIYPATDTTDPTQSPVGSTKKYSINQLANFMLTNVVGSALVTVYCSSTFNLNATYNNGTNGIGATLTNAGFLTGLMLDGIFPVGGERVLITNQTNQTQNGIYIVTNAGSLTQAWVLTRATDFDNSASSRIVQGNYLPVLFGNLNALTFWFLISPTPITLGSDNVIFTIQNNASNESWVVQSSGTVTMSVNTGYTIANPSGIVYLTLPPISIPGDEIEINGMSADGWSILQGAGQYIEIGNGTVTTTGTGGSLSSVNRYDNVKLRCLLSNTIWTTVWEKSLGLSYI